MTEVVGTDTPAVSPDEPLIAIPTRSRLIRLLPLAMFVILTIAVLASVGVPLSSDTIYGWIFLGLIAIAFAGQRTTRPLDVVKDWAPFLVAIIAYDLVRGLADGGSLHAYLAPQLDFDRIVGLGATPTERLQGWLWDPDQLRPWDYLTWVTYISHFIVTPTIATVLWLRGSRRFREYALSVATLCVGACVTYFLYPATPPWLAAKSGSLPGVQRLLSDIGGQIPLPISEQTIFERGAEWSNQIAAMPSLHQALATLVAIFFWRGASRRLRVLLVAYPLTMAFALVYSGEHWLLDAIVGAAYAYVAWVVARRLCARFWGGPGPSNSAA